MIQGADFGDLPSSLPGSPDERRRLVVRSAVRIIAATVGLLVLYAFVPVPGTSGAGALVGLGVGLVAFVAIIGWQLLTVVRADHPVMRAVEVIALALPLVAVVFAFTYLSVSRADGGAFSEHLDRVDAMYYTMSTISTVGFGDIAAKSDVARVLVTVQMLFDLALIAGLVRLVVLASRAGLRRHGIGEPRDTDAGAEH